MKNKDLSIGIAGFGLFGQMYPDILRRQGVQRIKVATKEKVKDSRLEVCDDYKKLQDIDAVIISLPVDLHLEAVKYFAPKVPYLLIEKPLEINYRKAKKLVETIRKHQTGAMCGLTGLYHPEFRAMYSQLPRVGKLTKVTERIDDFHPRFRKVCEKVGVLTGNGIHTLHRFYKIAALTSSEKLQVKEIKLANKYFKNCRCEDWAQGKLLLGRIPFEFELSFRDDPKRPDGLPIPIDYTVEICGTKGKIRVTGWEKCESWIDDEHTVHYVHSAGPLKNRSQYTRIGLGLASQIAEFLRFIKSGKKTHFTLNEALEAHKLLEKCFKVAKYE